MAALAYSGSPVVVCRVNPVRVDGMERALNVTICRNASAVARATPSLDGRRNKADADPSIPVITVAGEMLEPGEAMKVTETPESGLPESSCRITRNGELSTEPGRPVCPSPDAFCRISLASAVALMLYRPSAIVVALAVSTTWTRTMEVVAVEGT